LRLPSAPRRRSAAKRVAQLATVLVLAQVTGCSPSSPVAAGTARPFTSAGEAAASAQQQKLARSIAQLRRERDALEHQASQPAPKPASTASKAPSAAAQAPGRSTSTAALSTSFKALSARLGGSMGLSYASFGQPAKSFGDLSGGVGWSTMKIPVAIAAVTQANGHPSRVTLGQMRLAITESDNNAAMAVWAGLGSPTTAAAQTQAILRQGGDTTTVVPSQVLRPGYTPFGQSNWSLADQATFAASLPCMANASQVLGLMGQITSSQRWGMGTLANTVAFKGGWGPDTDGAYLVRQMAVVHLGDGTRIGLALAARPADGSFDTGISDLNAMAGWIAANIRGGGTNRC
jgi:hypothetical protein